MADENTESLPVTLVRQEDQGMAVIGVTFEGAFLPLAQIKLGHVDARVQLARDQAEQEQQQQPQQ